MTGLMKILQKTIVQRDRKLTLENQGISDKGKKRGALMLASIESQHQQKGQDLKGVLSQNRDQLIIEVPQK